MSDDLKKTKADDNSTERNPQNDSNEKKIIDEADYKIRAPREKGPTAVGKGGDPLFRRIQASPEQLKELMEETQTVQDWLQRESSNNAALSCLEEAGLKEDYFAIKDGFGEYGKIALMGFKSPMGVNIPRLKIYDTKGEVIEVLTGPMVIEELNKRVLAYKNTVNGYEPIIQTDEDVPELGVISDYTGNPNDYTT